MHNEPPDVIPLYPHRHLRAARRHAEAVAAKLSMIACEVHGTSTMATCTVEAMAEGEIITRLAQPPCCPAHAATLCAARLELDRVLLKETGLLAALNAPPDE